MRSPPIASGRRGSVAVESRNVAPKPLEGKSEPAAHVGLPVDLSSASWPQNRWEGEQGFEVGGRGSALR